MGFAFFSEASPGKTLASRNKNRKAHNLGLNREKIMKYQIAPRNLDFVL